MIVRFARALRHAFFAGLIGAGLAAPALGQYLGGDLNLNLDENRNIHIAAGDLNAEGRVDGDVTVWAGDVQFEAEVLGTLTITAGDINADGYVHGDADYRGGSISVMAPVDGDLTVASGSATVSAAIGGDARVSGADIEIERSGVVTGFAVLSGASLTMDGQLLGGADLRSRNIEIGGVINGPLEIRGGEVEFGSSAVISGPVTVYSPKPPEIAAGAQVGELNHVLQTPDYTGSDEFDVDFSFNHADPFSFPGWAPYTARFAAVAFILGALAALIAPRSVGRMGDKFRARPWVSLGLGFVIYATFWLVLLTLVPLLAATVIGIVLIPFAVLAIPISYLLAFVFGGFALGDLVLNRNQQGLGAGMRILSLLLVFLSVTAIFAVPILGLFTGMTLALLLNCIGFGVWALVIFDRQAPTTPASSVGAAPAEGAV